MLKTKNKMTHISENHVYEVLSRDRWKTHQEIKREYCNIINLNPRDIVDVLREPESHVIDRHLNNLVEKEHAEFRYRETNESDKTLSIQLEKEYRQLPMDIKDLNGYSRNIGYSKDLEDKLFFCK